MDKQLIEKALRLALPYVSTEGSASTRMLMLEAIHSVNPDCFKDFDKILEEQKKRVAIEKEWLERDLKTTID